MNHMVQDMTAATVVSALETNMCEAWACYGRVEDVTLHQDQSLTWVDTGVPSPWLNGIFRTQLSQDDVESGIAETVAHFRSRQRPHSWWTTPSSSPHNLGSSLEAHGLQCSGSLPGMALDIDTLNIDLPEVTGLSIERVQSLTDLQVWTQTATRGSGSSDATGLACYRLYARLGLDDDQPWHYYTGYLHGEPVATASLCLAGGVAGLYSIATLPHARGRGIGAHMCSAAVQDARTLGYRVAVLQSTRMGYSVYQRLGFQECCTIDCYVWSGLN